MDIISLANLLFTMITTVCALYLSLVALRHSALPRIDVRMVAPRAIECSTEHTLIFEFGNVGHWYAKPMAVNVVVYCNFDPHFNPIEIAFGSVQAYKDTWVGKGKMKYLKAQGIKLAYGEEWEAMHTRVVAPATPGDYLVRISAYSDNGASMVKEFRINCVATRETRIHAEQREGDAEGLR